MLTQGLTRINELEVQHSMSPNCVDSYQSLCYERNAPRVFKNSIRRLTIFINAIILPPSFGAHTCKIYPVKNNYVGRQSIVSKLHQKRKLFQFHAILKLEKAFHVLKNTGYYAAQFSEYSALNFIIV